MKIFTVDNMKNVESMKISERLMNLDGVPFFMSKVFFYPLSAKHTEEDILKGIEVLFHGARFDRLLSEGEFCPVKLHFGEKANRTFLSPHHAGRIVSLIRKSGAKPFLTDANTIYRGSRANSVDHINVAHEHGFLPSIIGAPIIIADGLTGREYRKLKVHGKYFKEIKVAAAVLECSTMMVISHFKGHMLAGFGGALKNIGMGLASRSGKQEQHSDVKPKVDSSTCIMCFQCKETCPVNAISDNGDSALIDHDKCIGCGECTATCPTGAIEVRWRTDNRTFQEKMIEYTSGILQHFKGNVGYFNILVNIVPHCDCMESSDPPIVEDIGILASRDPVALDRASVDLVNGRPGLPSSNFGKRFDAIPAGSDKFGKIHNINWEYQLNYAEKLGIGTQAYDIVDLSQETE